MVSPDFCVIPDSESGDNLVLCLANNQRDKQNLQRRELKVQFVLSCETRNQVKKNESCKWEQGTEKVGDRRSVRRREGAARGCCLVTHGEKERLAQSLVKWRPEDLGSIPGIHRWKMELNSAF